MTVRVCYVRSLEEEDNLLVRRKPTETAPFAWFSQKSTKSSQKSPKMSPKKPKSLPVALDGDVDIEMAEVHSDRTARMKTGNGASSLLPQQPAGPHKHKGGMLYISVIDSGAGISAENQKKLFTEIVQFNPEKLQVLFLCI